MAGWMVLGTVLLFVAASAVGCYPGGQRAGRWLTAAAVVAMIVTATSSALYKENMFSDALALPSMLWTRAVLAIVVCAGLGILLAHLIGNKR